MSTLKEIADLCNVSVSTVSLVLNKPEKISKDVRNQVFSTVIRLGYLVDRKVALKQVGVVFPNFYNDYFGDFYSTVIFGILKRAGELNVNLQIIPDLNRDFCDTHDLQGYILVGKTPDMVYEKAKQYKIPTVTCGHPNYRFRDDFYIYFSRFKNTISLMEHLVNKGHRHIAVLVGATDPLDIINQEFLSAIDEVLPNTTRHHIFYADYNDKSTVEIALSKITKSRKGYTALICGNDLLAYYVYQVANNHNLSIPADLSVTGYDGILFPRFVSEPSPRLTTVDCDCIDLGKRSLDLLADIIHCEKMKHPSPSRSVLLEGKLRIGESVHRIE